jgi:hypothetical protein
MPQAIAQQHVKQAPASPDPYWPPHGFLKILVSICSKILLPRTLNSEGDRVQGLGLELLCRSKHHLQTELDVSLVRTKYLQSWHKLRWPRHFLGVCNARLHMIQLILACKYRSPGRLCKSYWPIGDGKQLVPRGVHRHLLRHMYLKPWAVKCLNCSHAQLHGLVSA